MERSRRTLPPWPYAFADPESRPKPQREHRIREAAFREHDGELSHWATLGPIVKGITEDRPDGLATPFEVAASFKVAASLLAQLSATRGQATFLSGSTETTVRIAVDADHMNPDWDEGRSLIPRIALDAGYELSDAELRTVSSNIHFAGFSPFDDATERAVVLRDLDGELRLLVGQ